MPLAYWQDDYLTGDPQIDDQHQQLFGIINNLHEAMVSGRDRTDLKRFLDQLFDHALIHFQTEESMMMADRDPNYAHHRRKHEELQIQVFKLRQNVNQDLSLLSTEISQFLTAWLIHHIQQDDRPMVQAMGRGHRGHA